MLLAEALIEGFGEWGQTSLHIFFEIVISLLAIFLILLVLVQRGRGGGLAGALGGMGGQSAFGTRAGDTFTWITYITAAVWILLAMLTIKVFTDPAADRKAMVAERLENQSLTEEGATAIPRGKVDDTQTDLPEGDASSTVTPDSDAASSTDEPAKTESPKSDETTSPPDAKAETPPTDDSPSESKTKEDSPEPRAPEPAAPEPSTNQPEE